MRSFEGVASGRFRDLRIWRSFLDGEKGAVLNGGVVQSLFFGVGTIPDCPVPPPGQVCPRLFPFTKFERFAVWLLLFVQQRRRYFTWAVSFSETRDAAPC